MNSSKKSENMKLKPLTSEIPGFPNCYYGWQTHAGQNLASHSKSGTCYYIRAVTEQAGNQISFRKQQR